MGKRCRVGEPGLVEAESLWRGKPATQSGRNLLQTLDCSPRCGGEHAGQSEKEERFTGAGWRKRWRQCSGVVHRDTQRVPSMN